MSAESSRRDPAASLLAAFRRIHRERMQGLPILNPRLQVAVQEGGVSGDHWIGVLLTPWCMSLTALPAGDPTSDWTPGTTRTLAFPAGRFDLLVASEPDLGPYATCSLFSPMGDFADQETALATARAVLEALFVPEDRAPEGAASHGGADRGISRRALLRGSLGRA